MAGNVWLYITSHPPFSQSTTTFYSPFYGPRLDRLREEILPDQEGV